MKRFDPISLVFVFVCFASIAHGQPNAPLKLAQTIPLPTASGARTSLFVPELRKLYVAVPHRGSQECAIRVYDAVR